MHSLHSLGAQLGCHVNNVCVIFQVAVHPTCKLLYALSYHVNAITCLAFQGLGQYKIKPGTTYDLLKMSAHDVYHS